MNEFFETWIILILGITMLIISVIIENIYFPDIPKAAYLLCLIGVFVTLIGFQPVLIQYTKTNIGSSER